MEVRIKESSWVARIAAVKMKASKVAIVFGSTIHLHNTTRSEFLNDQAWVNHELMHVDQYKRYGFVGFISRYLVEWFRKGYYNNKYEVEARAAESS